jgi:hypothetical protein
MASTLPVVRCPVDRRFGAPTGRAAAVFLVLGLTLFPSVSPAADRQVYFALDGGVQAGDFGTPVRNTLYSVSSTLGMVTKKYDCSVTLPYQFLQQSSGGQSATESGLGDFVIQAGYVLVAERADGMSLNGALAVKLPTADETQGLGTGKTDIGATFSLGQRLGPARLSLLGGFIKVGDPAGQDYNDVTLYGAGVSGTQGGTRLYASLAERRALIAGADNPLEVYVGFFHLFGRRMAIRGTAFAGLNDGGPEYGASLGFVQWI